ncbi:MAG TPA: hypothetical protein VH500_07340 [Nitrososphaeraceae archaeon]
MFNCWVICCYNNKYHGPFGAGGFGHWNNLHGPFGAGARAGGFWHLIVRLGLLNDSPLGSLSHFRS